MHSIDAHQATNLLPQLAAFAAVVEAGSFSGAARRAGVGKTLLSRRVQALERSLGVRLLNRTTRRLHTTEAGESLIRAAAEPLQLAVEALIGASVPDQVQGTVRIASVPGLESIVWGPLLRELAVAHEGIHLKIHTGVQMVDVVGGGFDLAIRSGNIPDSSLVMRRLATWRYLIAASPDWIASHPEVRHPRDLVPHWLLYDAVPNANQWRFEQSGASLVVEMGTKLAGSDATVLFAAAREGLGVVASTPFSVAEDLAQGRLVRVLPDWRVDHRMGIYAVTPHRAYLPGPVQVVIDRVRDRLSTAEPRWQTLTG